MCSSRYIALGTYLYGGDSFLIQIASVQFDWIFILVWTDDCFACFNDFLYFGTITTFWQFFDDNVFLEFTSLIDEAQFVEEAFAEFLKEGKNPKMKLYVIEMIIHWEKGPIR